MTQEEKAKAYDKVREKIALRFGSNVAEEIFSEYEESEDERIRKEIIYHIQNCDDTIDEVTEKRMLAWLKKQGEHAKFRDSIQVGDKVTRNRDGVLVNLSQLKRVAKRDEKQGEQKPAWSEEDKVMLDKVIERLHKHSAGDKEYLDIYYWLIALKDRVQPQPKQEWSMYDETILKTLIDHFEYKKEFNEAEDYDIVLWLKSLRPHNTWKPSVEEVVALEHAINCYSGISPTNANEVFILEIMKERLKNLTK